MESSRTRGIPRAVPSFTDNVALSQNPNHKNEQTHARFPAPIGFLTRCLEWNLSRLYDGIFEYHNKEKDMFTIYFRVGMFDTKIEVVGIQAARMMYHDLSQHYEMFGQCP